jgi:transposase InsO family protein
VRFGFIRAEKVNHTVAMLCRVLQVSRQGFYAWLTRRPCERHQKDATLARTIRKVFDKHRRRYGSPRVHLELRDAGVLTSRKRVARLMRQNGLVAKCRRRFVCTTNSVHRYAVAPNVLARNFTPVAPDRVWAADITYVPTHEGWLYLAVILDLYSRRVVGWSMQPYIDRRLVLGALRMAVQARHPAPGLVHHSDRGVQYACDDYREALARAGAAPSMSRTGDCWDNAPVESFFSSLKRELLEETDFATHNEARAALFEYIEVYYNRHRRHSTLGYRSPMDYEAAA